jgi:hypothetical protein
LNRANGFINCLELRGLTLQLELVDLHNTSIVPLGSRRSPKQQVRLCPTRLTSPCLKTGVLRRSR